MQATIKTQIDGQTAYNQSNHKPVLTDPQEIKHETPTWVMQTKPNNNVEPADPSETTTN